MHNLSNNSSVSPTQRGSKESGSDQRSSELANPGLNVSPTLMVYCGREELPLTGGALRVTLCIAGITKEAFRDETQFPETHNHDIQYSNWGLTIPCRRVLLFHLPPLMSTEVDLRSICSTQGHNGFRELGYISYENSKEAPDCWQTRDYYPLGGVDAARVRGLGIGSIFEFYCLSVLCEQVPVRLVGSSGTVSDSRAGQLRNIGLEPGKMIPIQEWLNAHQRRFPFAESTMPVSALCSPSKDR